MRVLSLIFVVVIYSCDYQRQQPTTSSAIDELPNERILGCEEIIRKNSVNEITELGKPSNLELLNGFKWLKFNNQLSDYENCLSKTETLEDFTVGNIVNFEFLEKSWIADIIAHNGTIIKITLRIPYSSEFKISETNAIRNDFVKLLGSPNLKTLGITDQKKIERTAYVTTIFDAPRIYEKSSSIREELKEYHKRKNSGGITKQDLDDALSGAENNSPIMERLNNPHEYKKTIEGYFNYFENISFQDIWVSKLYLKCTYTRTSKLVIGSEYGSIITNGYYFKESWNPLIELYCNEDAINLEKKLDSLKKQAQQQKVKEDNERTDKEFLKKF